VSSRKGSRCCARLQSGFAAEYQELRRELLVLERAFLEVEYLSTSSPPTVRMKALYATARKAALDCQKPVEVLLKANQEVWRQPRETQFEKCVPEDPMASIRKGQGIEVLCRGQCALFSNECAIGNCKYVSAYVTGQYCFCPCIIIYIISWPYGLLHSWTHRIYTLSPHMALCDRDSIYVQCSSINLLTWPPNVGRSPKRTTPIFLRN
jgi:hypothetical protein